MSFGCNFPACPQRYSDLVIDLEKKFSCFFLNKRLNLTFEFIWELLSPLGETEEVDFMDVTEIFFIKK